MSFLSSIGDAISGIEKSLGPLGEVAKIGLDVYTGNPIGLAQDAASLLGGQSGAGGNAGIGDMMSLFGGSGSGGSSGLGALASLFGGGSGATGDGSGLAGLSSLLGGATSAAGDASALGDIAALFAAA